MAKFSCLVLEVKEGRTTGAGFLAPPGTDPTSTRLWNLESGREVQAVVSTNAPMLEEVCAAIEPFIVL